MFNTNHKETSQMLLKDKTGYSYTIELHRNGESIESIKQKVFEASGVTPENQRLILDGKELTEETYEACITNGWCVSKDGCSVTHIVERYPQDDFSNIQSLLSDDRIRYIAEVTKDLEREGFSLEQINSAIKAVYDSIEPQSTDSTSRPRY